MDQRSDLWPVGLIMLECVTGKRVVSEPSEEQQLMDLRLDSLKPPLSPPVLKLMQKSLQVQKEERWASAGELVHSCCMR